MKKCNKCDLIKPLEDFFRSKFKKDGRYSVCKECKTRLTAQWRKENREQYNGMMRKYNATHAFRLRLMRYKMTPEQHTAMLTAQRGVCAICEKPQVGVRPLAVDHDHKTGKVRGLLCYGCNRAIAILDSEEMYSKAKSYLSSRA